MPHWPDTCRTAIQAKLSSMTLFCISPSISWMSVTPPSMPTQNVGPSFPTRWHIDSTSIALVIAPNFVMRSPHGCLSTPEQTCIDCSWMQWSGNTDENAACTERILAGLVLPTATKSVCSASVSLLDLFSYCIIQATQARIV